MRPSCCAYASINWVANNKQFPEIIYMRGSKEEVIKKLSKALVIY